MKFKKWACAKERVEISICGFCALEGRGLERRDIFHRPLHKSTRGSKEVVTERGKREKKGVGVAQQRVFFFDKGLDDDTSEPRSAGDDITS